MGNDISFEEFLSYGSNTSDDVEWAITQAKLKKVSTKVRKLEDEFDALIRTGHYEDAHGVLTKALAFVKENSKFDWNLYFREEFRHYPPRGMFGYYGRIVAALFLSDETIALVDHLDQYIDVKQRELTIENIENTHQELQKIREPLSLSGQMNMDTLRELVPDLKKGGTDWRLRILEKCREIEISKKEIYWVPQEARFPQHVVPVFSMYYAKYSDMKTEQKAFYNDVFKPKFLAGEEVDVDKNWSYVFVLLHEMIRKRNQYREVLPHALERAYKMAPNESLGNYAIFWLADLRFEQADFEGGFEILVRGLSSPDRVLARATMVPGHRVQSKELLAFTNSDDGLATIGKREFDKVSQTLQQNLDQIHAMNGKSLIADLWDRIVDHIEKKQPLVWDRDEGLPFISETQANALLENINTLYYADPPIELFFGVPGVRYKEVKWPKQFPDIGFEGLREVFTLRLKAELRRAKRYRLPRWCLLPCGYEQVNTWSLLREA